MEIRVLSSGIALTDTFHIPRRNANPIPETPLPTFNFLNNEWELYSTEDDTGIRLCLCRGRCLPSSAFLVDPIRILVEVLSSADEVLPELSNTEQMILDRASFNLGYEWIWSRSTEDVERVVPNFSQDRLLKFRITLIVTPKDSEYWNSKRSRDAAVQACLNVNPIPCLESLSEDLSNVLKGADWEPDVVELHCDGHTIIGHKKTLCSRSPVLAAMLRSDMVEGNTGMAEIQNMDIDTFQRLLHYLYSGNLDDTLTFNDAMRLYEAGDMYQVQALVRRCSLFLIEKLTVDNAYDTLILAESHGDLFFKDAVVSFLLKEKPLLSGDQWEAFRKSRPSLAEEVLNRFSEMDISKDDSIK